MIRYKQALPAIAFSAFAVGCSTTNGALENSAAYTPSSIDVVTLETHLDTLRTSDFKYKSSETPDIAAVLDALPGVISVTYDEITTDNTGASVVSGLKFAPAMLPTIGLEIGQLRLWGLDDEFAVARLNGQRLEETASLARRAEASNITMFGIRELAGPFLAMAAASEEELAGMSFDEFNFSIDKIVYDDLVLRPYTVTEKALDIDEVGEYFPILQNIVAFNRSIAADTVATYGTNALIGVSQNGMMNSIGFNMDLSGQKGVRGGDIDHAFSRGFNYSLKLPSFAEEVGTMADMNVKMDRMSQSGVRLDKLFGYLTQGVMPPRTDSDLLSLGVMQTSGESLTSGGKLLYSTGSSKTDLSNFHWLIPTNLSMSAKDIVYDLAAFSDYVMSTEDLQLDAEQQEMFNGVMAALAKQGLDKPSMDFSFGWDWDANAGATGLGFDFGIDDFMHLDLAFDGALPTFNSVSNLVPDDIEATDQDALQNLFASESKFGGFTFNLKDNGGLDKGFAAAIDIAKLAPEDDSTAAMLRNSTPEGLRQMASSLMYMGAAALAEEVPAAQAYVTALAAFINEGGALHISAKPDQPLGMNEFMAMNQAEPDQIIDQIGLSLTHEASE